MTAGCPKKKSNHKSAGWNGLFGFIFCVAISLILDQKAWCIETWPFEITSQTRPGTYWWCPGSAFDKDSVDWNLEKMKEAGIGTAHIIPIYGARGYEECYIDFLSPKWMDMLNYIIAKADQLGMRVDMTTGTGWCFGGPDIPAQYRDAIVSWQNDIKEIKMVEGMKVKRAAPGGEGPMLNPFSSDAMSFYLQVFSKAFDRSKSRIPRAQYHDSFEYKANWSADFLEQFQKKRGYDLKPHLEMFFGDAAGADLELKSRLKYDYRHTLAQLHLEFIETWAKWSKDRGMLTRNEAHGSPSNLLDVYAAADIPETEMFGAPEFSIPGFRRDPRFCRAGDNDPLIMKMASSAAHVAHKPGRQLVSSESFTWLREHWHSTLGQIKLSADLFFLAGINHLFYHGTCYSPKDARWPGWFFYASTEADWRNSIWHDIGYLNDYIARCQSVLQAGRPASDVLIYWPIHDLWMNPEEMQQNMAVHDNGFILGQPVGCLAQQFFDQGYAFDFISDRMLNDLTMAGDLIQAPGGTYRAIVVPVSKYMPAETMQQLARLANAGAAIVFEERMPDDVPGLEKLDEQRKVFAAARDSLQKKAVVAQQVFESLANLKVTGEPMLEAGLKCIRRYIDGRYWYFIANHSAKAVDQWVPFSLPFTTAVCYDPMTGRSGTLAVRRRDTQTQAYIQMQAGESVLLCTGGKTADIPSFHYLQADGKTMALQGTWQIEFIEGGPELPKTYSVEKLASWTESTDPAAEAFAGTVRYSTTFQMPEKTASDWMIDLGDVRESARIRVNGEKAGELFALPFRMNIGNLLKPGKNTLEIEVTNLSANRIRALERSGKDWKIMRDANIVNVNYEKFNPAEWPLEPSGLLGPVQLIPMRNIEPAADEMPPSKLPDKAEILNKMTLANGYFMNKWPDPGKPIVTNKQRPSNIWTRGTYYEGLMALYGIDSQKKYYDYAVAWGNANGWSMRSGTATRNADDQCCGQTYIDLYRIDPQPERIEKIKQSIDAMVNSEKNDDWWWIDALQMAMPVFARLGAVYKDNRYYEKMYDIYMFTKEKQGDAGLYNPKDCLWWRDKNFKPPYTAPNGQDCYWSRGNGWVFAALVRVLDVMPSDAPHRDEYVRTFKEMAAALLPIQRPDGFWNASLHDPTHFGGKELTGTAFFTYGFVWGVRNGLLDKTLYLPAAIRGWNSIISDALHPEGFLGYVQGTGDDPSDGQPVAYDKIPDFEDYGLGAFLLAGSEMYKIAEIDKQ